jgi:hypothetical protein
MSEETVYGSRELTRDEWQLVDLIKRTMAVLAKVTKHKNLEQVKKDIDPRGEMDPEVLNARARQHLTPDLPGLSDSEEAVAISQLMPAVFEALAAMDGL